MRALVLGGTGFVGRHICEALAADGAVLPLSTTSTPALDLMAADGVARLAELLAEERPDLLVNAAGRAWRADAEEMERGNAALVDRLLDAVAAAGPTPPRLIHLGSVHEYGPGSPGAGTPEDHPPAPVTPYGRSKLRGTRSVLRAQGTGGLEAVVLRAANVCGPGAPDGSLLGVVAGLLVRAAAVRDAGGTPEPLRFASLSARRDFVDVRDVAEAVRAAARAPAAAVAGEIVNIGRGRAVPARWLVERLVALSGLDLPVVVDESAGSARADVEWQQLDIGKARRVLGWSPRRELDESLCDLLEAVMRQTTKEGI